MMEQACYKLLEQYVALRWIKLGIMGNNRTHFVKKEEYLIEILNHNFYPRLSLENAIKPFLIQ